MEKALLLKAEVREKTGSHAAVGLRKQGRIPAVVYGHKQEPIAISLDAHELTKGLLHGHRVMDIQMGKEKQKVWRIIRCD